MVLIDGAVSVPELRTRLSNLFTDVSNPATVITCSSVHKAKGLEADRVYILQDTLYPIFGKKALAGIPPDVLAARAREEANIEYVACTRARKELVLVGARNGGDLVPRPEPVTPLLPGEPIGHNGDASYEAPEDGLGEPADIAAAEALVDVPDLEIPF